MRENTNEQNRENPEELLPRTMTLSVVEGEFDENKCIQFQGQKFEPYVKVEYTSDKGGDSRVFETQKSTQQKNNDMMKPLWTNQTHQIEISKENIDTFIKFRVENSRSSALGYSSQYWTIRSLIEEGKRQNVKQVQIYVQFDSGKLLVKFEFEGGVFLGKKDYVQQFVNKAKKDSQGPNVINPEAGNSLIHNPSQNHSDTSIEIQKIKDQIALKTQELLEKSKQSDQTAALQKQKFAKYMGTLFMNQALIQVQKNDIEAKDKTIKQLEQGIHLDHDIKLQQEIQALKVDVNNLQKTHHLAGAQKLEIQELQKEVQKYEKIEKNLKQKLEDLTLKQNFQSVQACSNAKDLVEKWKSYMVIQSNSLQKQNAKQEVDLKIIGQERQKLGVLEQELKNLLLEELQIKNDQIAQCVKSEKQEHQEESWYTVVIVLLLVLSYWFFHSNISQ